MIQLTVCGILLFSYYRGRVVGYLNILIKADSEIFVVMTSCNKILSWVSSISSCAFLQPPLLIFCHKELLVFAVRCQCVCLFSALRLLSSHFMVLSFLRIEYQFVLSSWMVSC